MNTATLNLSHLIRLTALLVIAVISVPAQAADFFFRNGDVVVMIGDSITEQHLYSNYVEMWTVTRFPNWNLTFRNVGIGGDRSVGGNARFERDVLLHKPTAMTVDFGMNDGSYREFSEATFKPYMEGLQGMANQAKAANLRTAWITPQPLDADEQGPTALTGYNVTLEKFSEGVKTIAGTNAGLFVDQFHPYLSVLDHARHSGPKYERITDGDAVHPGPPGQALMAASILKGLNFPAQVASVEIDAVTKKTVSADNCSTENIVAKDGGIRFSKTDNALPFFPEDANSILKWTPILEELNDYRLKITGLPAGNYEVHVDGVKVTELTSEQLSAGANIAAAVLKTGPIADQSRAVRQAVEQKNRFHHDRIFRGIVLSNVPDWIDEVISRDELDSKRQSVIGERLRKLREFDREVKDALVTKSHTFDILPVK